MPDTTTPHPFSQDKARFADLGRRMLKELETYIADVDGAGMDRRVPDDVRRELMAMALPEEGQAPEEMLAFLRDKILPWPITITHPRSYAWICAGFAPMGALADLAASTMNTGLDGYDHSSIFLNVAVGRWLMELTGFSDGEGFGVLFSGGSAANLNALTAARHKAAKDDGWDMRAEGLQGGRPRLMVYSSAEAHSSIQKCVEQLGLGAQSLRLVETDDRFRLVPAALRSAIRSDLDAGLRPFCVVAGAGTTNVGAIDPLKDVADICEEFGLWFHVDGAYGGFGRLDPDYTEMYLGIERADTLTIDPHKWLQAPVDCGALLMRHPERHAEAFGLTPDYLISSNAESAPWPYEHMFQLTYANRALKTWAVIARLGRDGVRELVTRCNRLARLLGALVEEAPELELMAPVSLSIVTFRYRGEGGSDDAELDRLNTAISDAIAKSGEAHMPTTKVRGRVALRACILHYENCEADMHHLFSLVRRCAAAEVHSSAQLAD